MRLCRARQAVWIGEVMIGIGNDKARKRSRRTPAEDWQKEAGLISRGWSRQTEVCRTLSGAATRAVRTRDAGFTILEIIIVITILSVLTAASVPLMQNSVRRQRESDLRLALRTIRKAIDDYKFYNDRTGGAAIPIELRTQTGYPKELKLLYEGFIPANVVGTSGNKVKFLRRIPVDPMTGSTEWGVRSYKDNADSSGGAADDLFDLFSKSDGVALDGSKYKTW